MFYKCKTLKNIDDLKFLNTKYCNDFNNMFNGCSILTNIKPLENWDVSNGKDFSSMFAECSSLSDIKPLENWNVSNGKYFGDILYKCSSLYDRTPLRKWKIFDEMIFNQILSDFEMKICLVSMDSVGKTSIINRYCYNTFDKILPNTIGGNYNQKKLELKTGAKVELHIWDTTGNERFVGMTHLYIRDSKAVILVYDVTKEKSLEDLNVLINELNKIEKEEDMILYLVGNKNDVDPSEKKVPTSKGKEFAEKKNMIFYEVSAKTGLGIKELFMDIAIKEFNNIKQ